MRTESWLKELLYFTSKLSPCSRTYRLSPASTATAAIWLLAKGSALVRIVEVWLLAVFPTSVTSRMVLFIGPVRDLERGSPCEVRAMETGAVELGIDESIPVHIPGGWAAYTVNGPPPMVLTVTFVSM